MVNQIREFSEESGLLKQLLINFKHKQDSELWNAMFGAHSYIKLWSCEAWTISKATEKRLVSSEMYFLKCILKISWIERISNKEIVQKAQTSLNLIKTIHDRQFGFFWHAMGKNTEGHVAITGKFEGTKVRGRQQLLYTRLLANRKK